MFCKYGWHRPLRGHKFTFTDVVSGKGVYKAQCNCNKTWMVDGKGGFSGFKVLVTPRSSPLDAIE